MTAIALVHGGGTTARFWDLLRERLTAENLAIDLPGRGDRPADLQTVTLADAIESVSNDLAGVDDRLVLVAHSSGGLVVPGVVANLGGKIGEVVLNAASVPPESGTGIECMQARHRDSVRMVKEMMEAGQFITTPPDPPDPDRAKRSYGGAELDEKQVEFVRSPLRWVPDTYNFYFGSVEWSAAKGVPVTYVVNLRDRAVPLELQEEMIERLPSPPRVIPLDCGHIPAITMPEVFGALLDGIAAHCG